MRTLLCVLVLLAVAAPALALPKLSYVVRVLPVRGEWRFLVVAEGIDASIKDVGVFLPGWGGWMQLGGRVLTGFACEPPAVPVPGKPGQFKLRIPLAWNGKLRAVYTMRPAAVGSDELRQVPLVVRRSGGFELGFAQGLLLGLSEQIYEQPAERTLHLIPPPGWSCATGYAAPQPGPARVRLDERYANGVIAVGRRMRRAATTAVDTPVEVAQLGEGPRADIALRDALAAAWDRLCRDIGDVPLPRVTAVLLPVSSWGTFTPNGIHLGFELDDRVQAGRPLHREYARSAVHELTHAWVGHALQPADRSLEWFNEGFTEYLALRTLVAIGLAEREWLGHTLLSFWRELDSNPHATRIAFLTPRPHWRDDGAVEALIYRKAPLVALALDVALRRRGHAGLPRMIGDLIHAGGRLDAGALVAWLHAHGMKDFTARYLAAPGMPDVIADLAAVGIRASRAPTHLTDLGLRLEGDAPLVGRVAEVERGGPADRAGVHSGDRVFGASPLRASGTAVEGAAPGRFSYGIRLFEPGRAVRLHLIAGGRTRVATVSPRLRPGWVVRIAVDPHPSTIPYFFISR